MPLQNISIEFVIFTSKHNILCKRPFPIPKRVNKSQYSVADPAFSPGGGGRQLPKVLLFFNFFSENCMKMEEFGPGGGRASLGPPLDPPMVFNSCNRTHLKILIFIISRMLLDCIGINPQRHCLLHKMLYIIT